MVANLRCYEWYSKQEILNSLANEASANWFCDESFAVMADGVVCLFRIDTHLPKANLDSHRHISWKPKYIFECDRNLDNREKLWFPSKLYAKHLFSKYHILVGTESHMYCYLGKAHLASYGGSYGNEPDVAANFSLFDTIPPHIWQKLGGYDGWKVTLYPKVGKPIIHYTTDVETFLTLLSKVDSSNTFGIDMEQFDEMSLSLRLHESGIFFDNGWEYASLSDVVNAEKTTVYWGNGEPISITTQDIIPFELASKVVKRFFLTRQIPDLVCWKQFNA